MAAVNTNTNTKVCRSRSASIFQQQQQLLLIILMMLLQSSSLSQVVMCYQHKVGDLHAWGIPPSSNPHVYTKWSKSKSFRVGDSLLFLYPPSEDSVIQVTLASFKSCNIKDPILFMNDGNSLYNITAAADVGLFFTSGKEGHCDKGQKLYVSLNGNGTAVDDAYAPSSLADETAAAAAAPSYQNVFGDRPTTGAAAAATNGLLLFSTRTILTAAFVAILF